MDLALFAKVLISLAVSIAAVNVVMDEVISPMAEDLVVQIDRLGEPPSGR
jgi:hypothetical protein